MKSGTIAARKPISRRDVVLANAIPLAMLGIAARLHAWAGEIDEGHAVWHPVGHGTAFAAWGWTFAILIAANAALIGGRRAPLAFVALACALGGMALLFWPG